MTELSNGVYKSLLTTAAGLVVATPTFVAYSYLSSRVNTMLHDMERAGIEIVHMLTENDASQWHYQFPATGREGGGTRGSAPRPLDARLRSPTITSWHEADTDEGI